MLLHDLSEETVRNALKRYEALFSSRDVDGILEGFADDVRVRYASYAPFTGKAKLRDMLQRRFASMRDYRLSKRLEFVSAPRIASSWTGTWTDVGTGEQMELFGLEVLIVRDGKITEWYAGVSTWCAGHAAKT